MTHRERLERMRDENAANARRSSDSEHYANSVEQRLHAESVTRMFKADAAALQWAFDEIDRLTAQTAATKTPKE